jgi:hypothetical protein
MNCSEVGAFERCGKATCFLGCFGRPSQPIGIASFSQALQTITEIIATFFCKDHHPG